ncbi:P-loop containing nucleoside triphosphate hydrolase protein [Xylaria arbuscula]|nr:P-loop containing nucleoside triphosphate hydrolase protein [Xylaria arbuscula]
MGPQNAKSTAFVSGSTAYDDKKDSNRQIKVERCKSKDQRMLQPDLTPTAVADEPNAVSTNVSKGNKHFSKKPGEKPGEVSSLVSKKRKRGGGSGRPGNTTPKKRRRTGKIARRKNEIKNQLANMSTWRSRDTNPESEIVSYTTKQLECEKKEFLDAKELLREKYAYHGQENDYENELGLIEGMTTPLRDYQTVGVAFMLRQERSRKTCRGGIIADDMGLGKTVQSIACMLANPPSNSAVKRNRGASLIIVPNRGLVKQWTAELSKHAGKSEDVCEYVGGAITARMIGVNEFVIATYSQVVRDFKLFNSQKKGKGGALFRVQFYRIILDEGDNIKNLYGITSKACIALNATLKWVLSGTPLRNSIDECIPYFLFLGINVEERLASFTNRWGPPESDDIRDRTMQVLAKIMLRRESGQLYIGRAVCELPRSFFEEKMLSITDEEKVLSRHLELVMRRVEEEAMEERKRAREVGAEEFDEGDEVEDGLYERGGDNEETEERMRSSTTSLKSSFQMRVNWLRQAVDHPFLLENCIRNVMSQDELKSLISDLEEIEISKKENKLAASSEDESPVAQPEGPGIIEIALEIALDMRHHIDDVLQSRNVCENDGCTKCTASAELQSLECGHLMCRSCYERFIGDAAAEKRTQVKCLKCSKTIAHLPRIKTEYNDDNIWPLIKATLKPRNEVLQTADGRKVTIFIPSEMTRRSPGDDFHGRRPQLNESTSRWLNKCDEKGFITASTKTMAAVQMVEEWQKVAPRDQIVIFTEWYVTAQVIGRLLNKRKINFVYYNGRISAKNREKSLEDFKTNPEIKVMIMGVKAGNVGLNITNANRMIIINPWWNQGSESQAFGRIKRHGQTKETHLVCLFAKDTIDERILKMQNEKLADIKEAMSQGKKPKPLSHEERCRLLTSGEASDPVDEGCKDGDEEDEEDGDDEEDYEDDDYSDYEGK